MCKRLLVVFGAGASWDVRGAGTDVLRLDKQPPLAAQLFDGSRYGSIMARYHGAATLGQRLAGSSGSALEERLRDFSAHQNPALKEAFKGIPPYLHDVLEDASWNYVRLPSAYTSFVVAAAGETGHEICAVTLNYDRLLERALELYQPNTYEFNSLTHYCSDARQIRVVKAHGSVDWWRPLGTNNWEKGLRNLDLSVRPDTAQLVVRTRVADASDMRHASQYWYPVLTAPLAGKDATHLVCPSDHLQYLKEFLSGTDKVLFAGTSGYDTDVLDLLASGLPSDWDGRVQHVGNAYANALAESAERIEQAVPQLRPAHEKRQHGRSVFGEGFARYAGSPEMMEFLDA